MRTTELTIELDESEELESLRKLAAPALGLDVSESSQIEVFKRSIDARHGKVRIRYLMGVRSEEERPIAEELRELAPSGKKVIIVGGGPAGLFCAYQLARQGVASVVVERGKKVQPRRKDLKGLTKGGVVNPDSNYCFGEGGAGTYSDGKLYTRAHKRGDVRDVIEILVRHGAPHRILSDARPHIGSNKLPKVVTAMREALEAVGVEFRFESRVVNIEINSGKAEGVKLASGEVLLGDAVVIATGHSARDIFQIFAELEHPFEDKGFALGVRIEHPQPLINQIQYGKSAGHPKLPAAAYRLVHKVEERGVFSFCMCPGGWIVPASTEEGGLVVNGMSLSKRDSPFANSGMVVSVEPEDWRKLGFSGALGGIDFQRKIEESAWQAGGGGLVAPGQRVVDFLKGRESRTLPKTSYVPGLASANIAEVVDSAGGIISERLSIALRAFGKKMRGYISKDAVLVGVESRTSAPLRIVRGRQSLESPKYSGLYPCGEGAGYAGGIVSAAMDGMRVAKVIGQKRTV